MEGFTRGRPVATVRNSCMPILASCVFGETTHQEPIGYNFRSYPYGSQAFPLVSLIHYRTVSLDPPTKGAVEIRHHIRGPDSPSPYSSHDRWIRSATTCSTTRQHLALLTNRRDGRPDDVRIDLRTTPGI